MKKCSKCQRDRELINFHIKSGRIDQYSSYCKECESTIRKKRYKDNKEKEIKQRKDWYLNNKDKKKEIVKRFETTNPNWRNKYQNNYNKNRKQVDINFKILSQLRTRLNKAIKGLDKSATTQELLGCSIEELKTHLESKFTPGMSWSNNTKKGWHIDHIKPLSLFNLSNPEQQREACHYTNLQPLWAKDNLSKGAKYG
jgi:hypothetical protein